MIQIGEKPAGLDAPLEHLIACHRRIEQRLSTLVRAVGELEHDYEKASEAIGTSLRFMDTNGALHTEDEEASLFPRLRSTLSAEELGYVAWLQQQHGTADSVYAELKEQLARLHASADHPPSHDITACRDLATHLQEIYQKHIASEEAILLPLARRSLDSNDLESISNEMRQRRAVLANPVRPEAPCPTV